MFIVIDSEFNRQHYKEHIGKVFKDAPSYAHVVELGDNCGKQVARVKWWNDTKGYGFLSHDNLDVFVHYTAIVDNGFKTLAEEQLVTFDLLDGPKGPQALNVRKVPQ
jgi:CspA family cold shock protein